MVLNMTRSLAALSLALGATAACAQASPVGLWKTIDDDGHTEKSTVRIVEQGGELQGRIESLKDPERQDARCDKCTDARKDQRLIGFELIRHVKHEGEGVWGGGDITDPGNGKIYKVRLKPIEGGRKLEVRGYLGFSLLGRTQTWLRAD